jgi:hypothetical protein
MPQDNKYHCYCGDILSFHSVPRHFKTDKHLRIVELKKDIDNLYNRLLHEKYKNISIKLKKDESNKVTK